jgi:hypothetical protein
MGISEELIELIKQLPPELKEEVRDFIEFLIEKRGLKKAENFVKIGREH